MLTDAEKKTLETSAMRKDPKIYVECPSDKKQAILNLITMSKKLITLGTFKTS